MAVKDGWTGRVYEDFEVGDIYPHPLGRTVLPVDNSWFSLLTQNINPIHFDRAYAAQTEFKQPLVDSTFTLALVTGQSTFDLSFNVMANLGWDEVRLPNPLFEGDTVYSRSEVLEKRESKSRPNVGIVKVKTTGFARWPPSVASGSASGARRSWNGSAPIRSKSCETSSSPNRSPCRSWPIVWPRVRRRSSRP